MGSHRSIWVQLPSADVDRNQRHGEGRGGAEQQEEDKGWMASPQVEAIPQTER